MGRLDYFNSLIFNTPATHIARLQHIQNYAAGLVCWTPKFYHITPDINCSLFRPGYFFALPATGGGSEAPLYTFKIVRATALLCSRTIYIRGKTAAYTPPPPPPPQVMNSSLGYKPASKCDVLRLNQKPITAKRVLISTVIAQCH